MKKNIKKKNLSGTGKCDICQSQTFLDMHHINGRKVKNANSPYNLTSICQNCHRSIHMGQIIIEGWFMGTNGRELLYRKNDEPSITERQAVVPLVKK